MVKSYVAIVGRPNVGKSTLFNRIVGTRRAVVSDIPGTTRDRIIDEAEWNDRTFTVVDTGGIEILPDAVTEGRRPGPAIPLLEDSAQFIPLIRAQAELAIEEADLILFLTDAITGLTGADREIAELLRRSNKPVLLVANKADNERRELEAVEFYELGLGDVHSISAIHGKGVADLLDEVVELLPQEPPEEEFDEEMPRIAILGRPNVGKSSLLNRLLGEERAIVSPVSGTTRDALDTVLTWEGQPLILIDTAGIRRRGKIEPGVEKYSVLRALKATERADVALLLLDAVEGNTAQDAHIAGIIAEQGVSVVALINKWDAVSDEVKHDKALREEQVRDDLKFMPYVPILFISALTGMRVNRVIPTALEVMQARYQRIPNGPLNDMFQNAILKHSPPSKFGRKLRLYYATQAAVAPPTFVLFVNDPQLMHFSYHRYLENCIRAVYPFPGTPVRIVLRPYEKGGHSKQKK
ncbi:MAG: ribosome biogenesis GTPase Der [Anaerolineae bacterium]|jgi:GTP-binding protein|nr:ribosome biogenesis GTPase Der [Anaerolineae bacterium]